MRKSIIFWINEHFKLEGEKRVDKDHPLVAILKDWVDEMYADGRTTSLANQEIEDKISQLEQWKELIK